MNGSETRAISGSVNLQGGSIVTTDGRVVTIGQVPVIVGRHPDCGLCVDSATVSNVHCELVATPDGVRVRDLGSRNGTFVAAVRVEVGLLTRSTTLHVAHERLEFRASAPESVSTEGPEAFGPLVGGSSSMKTLYRVLADVAPTELSVLITGETGTGKELAAEAIHRASRRSSGPFVVVDCTAIPSALAESLLFGHERGAYTGATERRRGAFQEASGGTLFLDELGELPLEVQPKFLRALAERKVKPVGSNNYESADVRIVAATRRDLGRQLNGGTFRSDLFFRIAQLRIELPTLRDRRDDVPAIARSVCARLGRQDRVADVLTLLESRLAGYDWPGNVRELVNVVSVVASLPAGAETVGLAIPLERGQDACPVLSAYADAKRAALEAFERSYFTTLLESTAGNISEASRRSGLSRHYVRGYLQKHGLSGGQD